ncbi:AraC family transcriptional regulator [Frigidibacter sp. MR17.24]|uniref:AraC family transcriptional regulator n=1 Tax=Frigidibacter sp. MR17.24 TaxID=3127345 RepID=UPI00301319BA
MPQSLSQVTTAAASGLAQCLAQLGAAHGAGAIAMALPEGDAGAGGTMPLLRFASTLEQAAAASRTPDLGLRFAERFDIRRIGALGYRMHHAGSLRDGLEAYVAHYDKVQSHTRVGIALADGRVLVSYDARDPLPYDRRQDAEFSVGIVLGYIRQVCGSRLAGTRLHFGHAAPNRRPPADDRPFAVAPDYDAGLNAVSIPEALLDLPCPAADPVLAQVLADHLRREPPIQGAASALVRQLRAVMEEMLADDQFPQVDAVAARLGQSGRGLQRLCQLDRTSFRSLRIQILMDIAAEWIREDGAQLTEIAHRLNYSDASAFSRAFRAHFGQSPSAMRRQLT